MRVVSTIATDLLLTTPESLEDSPRAEAGMVPGIGQYSRKDIRSVNKPR